MANASDARPQQDAEKIELVGLERSRNIALTAISLYRPWQGEVPPTCTACAAPESTPACWRNLSSTCWGCRTGMEFLCGVVHDIGKLVLV